MILRNMITGNLNSSWNYLSLFSKLNNEEVHFFLCEIKKFMPYIDILKDFLTPPQIEKSNRFVFEKDRNSFIISQGILRKILSSYTNIEVNKVKYYYNKYGKPFLEKSINNKLKFNLSHSKEFCLIGVTLGNNIGVDIEMINKDINTEDIVRNYFSENEIINFKKVSKENKNKTFFKIWTRKEAFIKALGMGLSFPLKDFDVDLNEFDTKIRRIKQNESITNFYLNNIEINSNYCAASVNIGKEKKVKKFLLVTDKTIIQ